MEAGGPTRLQTVSLALTFGCLLLAIIIRVHGMWWDQGGHLHPDERMIIMVAERISFPNLSTLGKIFYPESPLNPKFFAYGSLPIYLLSFTSWLFGSHTYDGMLLVGRLLSLAFEIGILLLLFLFARKLKISQLATMLFYTFAVLPIQSSHFFISDIPLTFFCFAFLYSLINWYEKKSQLSSLIVGCIFGCAVATKITAIVLVAPLLTSSLLLFFHKGYRKQTVLHIALIGLVFLITFSLIQPYTWIDFQLFRQQISEQTAMRNNPYIFPYTLQYVYSLPYVYFLEQYVKWGVGIPMALGVLGGLLVVAFKAVQKVQKYLLHWQRYESTVVGWLLVLLFGIAFFVSIGGAAVKFMRYMLPIYPITALLFGKFVSVVIQKFWHHKQAVVSIGLSLYGLSCLVWPVAFLSIFSKEHTRITADNWIHSNIPYMQKIAVEHWDDRLPLSQSERYQIGELKIYDIPDDDQKWQQIHSVLSTTDYVIVASNRLYTPLTKLADCSKVQFERCYPKTAQYYTDLFTGALGFNQVATFESYPTITLGPWKWEFNDQSADESFTVYDHPKIMIFQKKNDDSSFKKEIQ